MPDPTDHPEIPAAITDEPRAAGMEPESGEKAMKKMTHEVDSDDMYSVAGV